MSNHVCPWWIGYFLLIPFRRRGQNPRVILSPYVSAGMTVLEPGPGMGFFTLDLARLVGPDGRVIAVDIQSKMIEALRRRAQKAGVLDRIETRLVSSNQMGVQDLNGKVDVALAFYMVHELPDADGFFHEVFDVLKPAGRLLFAEPVRHVSEKAFAASLQKAEQAGFKVESRPTIRASRTAVLVKK